MLAVAIPRTDWKAKSICQVSGGLGWYQVFRRRALIFHQAAVVLLLPYLLHYRRKWPFTIKMVLYTPFSLFLPAAVKVSF